MDHPGMLSQRPLPAFEPHTETYWRSAKERRFVLQQCTTCREVQFPPERTCSHCGAPETAWVEASGRAKLYTWTVCHPPLLPYFAQHAPWTVVAVELEEGPRMATQLMGIEAEQYQIGMPLVVDFEDVDEEHTLVVFRPEDN